MLSACQQGPPREYNVHESLPIYDYPFTVMAGPIGQKTGGTFGRALTE